MRVREALLGEGTRDHLTRLLRSVECARLFTINKKFSRIYFAAAAARLQRPRSTEKRRKEFLKFYRSLCKGTRQSHQKKREIETRKVEKHQKTDVPVEEISLKRNLNFKRKEQKKWTIRKCLKLFTGLDFMPWNLKLNEISHWFFVLFFGINFQRWSSINFICKVCVSSESRSRVREIAIGGLFRNADTMASKEYHTLWELCFFSPHKITISSHTNSRSLATPCRCTEWENL